VPILSILQINLIFTQKLTNLLIHLIPYTERTLHMERQACYSTDLPVDSTQHFANNCCGF